MCRDISMKYTRALTESSWQPLAKLRYEPFGLPPLHPIPPPSPSSHDCLVSSAAASSAAARPICNPPPPCSPPSPPPPPSSPAPPHQPPETPNGTSLSSQAPLSAGDDARQGDREDRDGGLGAHCKAILFDPKVLAAYLLSTYQLLHPVSRRKLARSDCQVFSALCPPQ